MEKSRKKIVRVIARLNTGGPARHVVWLTKGLTDYDSLLVCGTVPAGEGDMSYFAAENEVEPFLIPEMSRELSLKDIISLWKMFRLLQSEKPDIIHTHTAKAGTIGRVAGFLYRWLTPQTLIGKPRKVKFVHTYHGHVFHGYYGTVKTRIFLTIEQVLARLVTDKIAVLSEQQRREINQDFKVGKARQFAIIPLGIDLSIFNDWQKKRPLLREELNAADDEILVGLVGRLTEIKNHSLFLKVADLYKKQKQAVSPKLRFIIIGDGHLREKLEAEARDLNVTDIVEFVGERKDTDLFYPALDIVALTSLNEGTPLSLIEAMANARPVISTAVGGVVDLIGENVQNIEEIKVCKRGIGVPSGNPEAFLNGLLKLADNAPLRAELGINGEQFVKANYSKERLLSDIQKLYENFD